MPFSTSSFDQKRQAAQLNTPFIWRLLADAGTLPEGLAVVETNQDFYNANMTATGQVNGGIANQWFDIYTDTAPVSTSGSGGLPTVIHAGGLGTVAMVSDSAGDNSGAGLGLHKMGIMGFDAVAGAVNAEVITTNATDGTTPVNSADSHTIINWVPLSFGTNKRNLGNITFSGGANTMGLIDLNRGNRVPAWMIVPEGWVFIGDIYVKSFETNIDWRIVALGSSNLELVHMVPGTTEFTKVISGYKFEGPGVFVPEAYRTTAAVAEVTVQYDGILIKTS